MALLLSSEPAFASDGDDAVAAVAIGIALIVIFSIIFYFLPAIIAIARGHEFKWVILGLNLAVGWTVLGWAVALVWAVWPRERALIEPFVSNPTGLSSRNAGDALGAVHYGRTRGYERERGPLGGSIGLLSDQQMAQLERLSNLHRSGALTEAEFSAHKATLLQQRSF